MNTKKRMIVPLLVLLGIGVLSSLVQAGPIVSDIVFGGSSCSSCTGSATCDATECDGCSKNSGGSYSTCQASSSGSCASSEVQCGTRNWCNDEQGQCLQGEEDCSCNSGQNKVTGC